MPPLQEAARPRSPRLPPVKTAEQSGTGEFWTSEVFTSKKPPPYLRVSSQNTTFVERRMKEWLQSRPASQIRKPGDVMEVEMDQLRTLLLETQRKKRREARANRRLQRRCRVKGHENLEELEERYLIDADLQGVARKVVALREASERELALQTLFKLVDCVLADPTDEITWRVSKSSEIFRKAGRAAWPRLVFEFLELCGFQQTKEPAILKEEPQGCVWHLQQVDVALLMNAHLILARCAEEVGLSAPPMPLRRGTNPYRVAPPKLPALENGEAEEERFVPVPPFQRMVKPLPDPAATFLVTPRVASHAFFAQINRRSSKLGDVPLSARF